MDYIAIRIVLAGIGFIAPFLYFSSSMGTAMGLILGLIGGAIGFFLPMFWISNRRKSRNSKLEEQLPETLSLVANSLKAGFGLLQSLDLAAEQMDHPISTELATTIHEMNVGSSVEEALIALNERTESYDLDLVVTAILVQRSVGGNLSEILETVAATMRERIRIRGEIKTLTAQQTLTGIVIGLLPVAVGSLFMVISPEYMTVLFTETPGRIALGVAVVLESIGLIIIKRILAIEV
jgi:tight adherence protein B